MTYIELHPSRFITAKEIDMFVKTLVTIALMAAPLAAQAHGHHHSKPLAFEELPQNCQAHFKRAEACYAKASGPTAEFHRGNTKTLLDAMPAATPQQREQLCTIADREFAAKAKALHCE